MKKIILALSVVSIGFAYADQKINPDKQSVTCGNYKLTKKSTASDVAKNCKITKLETENHGIHQETEIKFEANTSVVMKCEFDGNGKMDKCKLDD